jgi:hypothetical protein
VRGKAVAVAGHDDTQGPDGEASFDIAAFVLHWQEAMADPGLRRSLRRFARQTKFSPEDLSHEVALRMIQFKSDRSDPREFIRLVETIGRRVAMDWRRDTERRLQAGVRHADRLRYATSRPTGYDAEAVEQFEWEVAVRQAMASERFAGLGAPEQRAVELILRGGPYSSKERVAIFRARSSLREFFDSLFIGVAVRIDSWRARVRNPHPSSRPWPLPQPP